MQSFSVPLIDCRNLYFMKYANQSTKTLDHKKYVIDSFILSLTENITQISSQDIAKWKDSLNVSNNTLNGNLVILRQFLSFANAFGIKSELPIIREYIDTYIPYLFTAEEINKLIEAADNNISYSRSANTKTFCFPMILRLLAFCGLRLNEALELEINDFYDEPGIIILHKTKNNRERVIPLHSSLSELLSLYKMKLLKIYPHSKYMFPDCTLKSTLTKGQIEYEFKKILSQVGLDNHHAKNERGICLHCFRHTFAVESFRKLKTEYGEIDNTIPILSTYLGHSRLNETEKYLKFSYDLFPEEAELFDDYCKDVFGGIL